MPQRVNHLVLLLASVEAIIWISVMIAAVGAAEPAVVDPSSDLAERWPVKAQVTPDGVVAKDPADLELDAVKDVALWWQIFTATPDLHESVSTFIKSPGGCAQRSAL